MVNISMHQVGIQLRAFPASSDLSYSPSVVFHAPLHLLNINLPGDKLAASLLSIPFLSGSHSLKLPGAVLQDEGQSKPSCSTVTQLLSGTLQTCHELLTQLDGACQLYRLMQPYRFIVSALLVLRHLQCQSTSCSVMEQTEGHFPSQEFVRCCFGGCCRLFVRDV